jgi:surface protein
MNGLFQGAVTFNQPLRDWDLSNTQSMANMFNGAIAFNQSLEGWKLPIDLSLIKVEGIFTNATAFHQPPLMKGIKFTNASLKEVVKLLWKGQDGFVKALFGPISDWDVGEVTDMSQLFRNKSSFNEDLSRWDVSNVTNMSSMFYGTTFNQPLNAWNTSKVTDMSLMFYNSYNFNQPLHAWDCNKVTNMTSMFSCASKFNQPLNAWKIDNIFPWMACLLTLDHSISH